MVEITTLASRLALDSKEVTSVAANDVGNATSTITARCGHEVIDLIDFQDATDSRLDLAFGCKPHNYILLVLDPYLTSEILNARLHQGINKSKGAR